MVKRNKQTLVTRELVVVPDSMSTGLLYSLHLNLKHPSCDQLHKVVDTRFFIYDLANKCKQVTEECTPPHTLLSNPSLQKSMNTSRTLSQNTQDKHLQWMYSGNVRKWS